MRRTLFKVCFWNDFNDREITIFSTSDYGEALKQAHTYEGPAKEVYVKQVMERPTPVQPMVTTENKDG